jgi:hypothetical protein
VPQAVFKGALAPQLSATKPRNGYFLRSFPWPPTASAPTASTCSTSRKRRCR